jgi:DNA-binding LytR/AlgR family response regulator
MKLIENLKYRASLAHWFHNWATVFCITKERYQLSTIQVDAAGFILQAFYYFLEK